MTDVHTPEQRSRNMAAIRSKDTKPELIVRRLVHGLGFRYRLHRRDLPGKPDLVFRRLRKVIFVHGCFWHMHDCRWGSVVPRINGEFWKKKRMGTVVRDRATVQKLHDEGWAILTVWECETKDLNKMSQKLSCFLASDDV